MYKLKITGKLLKMVEKSGSHALVKKLEKILKNPKAYGAPLHGDLQGFYKARVDPFRVIYTIDDVKKLVKVVDIDTRDKVYKHFNPD